MMIAWLRERKRKKKSNKPKHQKNLVSNNQHNHLFVSRYLFPFPRRWNFWSNGVTRMRLVTQSNNKFFFFFYFFSVEIITTDVEKRWRTPPSWSWRKHCNRSARGNERNPDCIRRGLPVFASIPPYLSAGTDHIW